MPALRAVISSRRILRKLAGEKGESSRGYSVLGFFIKRSCLGSSLSRVWPWLGRTPGTGEDRHVARSGPAPVSGTTNLSSWRARSWLPRHRPGEKYRRDQKPRKTWPPSSRANILPSRRQLMHAQFAQATRDHNSPFPSPDSTSKRQSCPL
jgi:hypothetical protein